MADTSYGFSPLPIRRVSFKCPVSLNKSLPGRFLAAWLGYSSTFPFDHADNRLFVQELLL